MQVTWLPHSVQTFHTPWLTAAGRRLMMDFVINEVKFEWILFHSRVVFFSSSIQMR